MFSRSGSKTALPGSVSEDHKHQKETQAKAAQLFQLIKEAGKVTRNSGAIDELAQYLDTRNRSDPIKRSMVTLTRIESECRTIVGSSR
ncbi:hypothetical protein HDU91_003463, partial [Kappamyces sp. JEL0680]